MWFYCFIILFHSFIMCLCCPPALRDIFPTSMARYSLFVLKVPLNTNQPNQTYSLFEGSFWTSSFHMHSVSFLSILVMVHDSLKSWSDVTVDQVETFCPPSQPVCYVHFTECHCMLSLHCTQAAAQCIVIGPVCFVCGWLGGWMCVCVGGCLLPR